MDLPTDVLAENARQATELLKSMANEHRLMILCLLAEREMHVAELGERVPLSQSALSQHLGVLRRSGLVRTRRDSRFIWYALEGTEAQAVMAALYQLYCGVPPTDHAEG